MLLEPIKAKDGGQRNTSLKYINAHNSATVKRRCRWTLTDPASQGQCVTCIETLDKSPSGCSTLMVHKPSVVHIHHTFIVPWCFHCLCCPTSLFWETRFPPAFCVNASHAKGKERKVGHGQMEHTVVRLLWLGFYFYFLFFLRFSGCSYFASGDVRSDGKGKQKQKKSGEEWRAERERQYWFTKWKLWSIEKVLL